MKVLRLLLVAALSLPILTLGLLATAFFNKKVEQQIWRAWAILQLRILGIKVRVVPPIAHQDFRNTMLMMLNQDSMLQVFVLPFVAPEKTRWLVNIEYAAIPILGWVHFLRRDFIIIRQSQRHSRRVFARVSQFLRSGGLVGLSIEGRRTADGSIGKYNKSPVVCAIASGATIVPFVIIGAKELMPFGSLMAQSGTVEVKILEGISTEGLSYGDRDQVIARLRALAEEHLNDRATAMPCNRQDSED